MKDIYIKNKLLFKKKKYEKCSIHNMRIILSILTKYFYFQMQSIYGIFLLNKSILSQNCL